MVINNEKYSSLYTMIIQNSEFVSLRIHYFHILNYHDENKDGFSKMSQNEYIIRQR